MDLFSGLGPTPFPHHFIQVFLLVALYEPCPYRRIEETLNITNSSVSRTLNALADEHRSGGPGLGLVTLHKDPAEGRRYVARLTNRGRAIVRQIKNL